MLARLCLIQGLDREFFWKSAQALEKVLKAGMLLNGASTQKLGHDLPKIWKKYKEALADYAPKVMQKPALLSREIWRDETIEHFLKWVSEAGHPDMRYGLRTYDFQGDELFKLDVLYADLRRRVIGLDWIVGADWAVDGELSQYIGSPYRLVIEDAPHLQFRNFKFPNGNISDLGSDWQDVLHRWNFAFTRSDNDLSLPPPSNITKLGGGETDRFEVILEDAKREKTTSELRNRVDWLIKNIELQKDDQKALLQAAKSDPETG